VRYEEYRNLNHQASAAVFDPKTGPFFQARFAGVPARGNCARLSGVRDQRHFAWLERGQTARAGQET